MLCCRAQQFKRAIPILRLRGDHFPRRSLMNQNVAVGSIVIDDEDSRPIELGMRHGDCFDNVRLFLEACCEPEGRAFPRYTFHTDFTTHHLHQLLRNHQP